MYSAEADDYLPTCSSMATTEANRLCSDPPAELRDLRMRPKPIDRVEFALQFFFRQELVNLGVTRPADPHHLSDRCPIEVALVPLIVVAGPWNQMMACQCFFAVTNRASGTATPGPLSPLGSHKQKAFPGATTNSDTSL